MTIYISASTQGFYDDTVYAPEQIPDDAVEISFELWQQLLDGQSAGKLINFGTATPSLSDPPKPVRTKAALLAEVAAKRWAVETGGVIVGGSPIATDRESQAQLTSAYTSLKNGLIENTPWKTADGTFNLVTLPQIEPVAQFVAAHVRACFAAEQIHDEAIQALTTQSELDAYDINAGWPQN